MSIFDLCLEIEWLILCLLLCEDYELYLVFCVDEEMMCILGGV